MAAMYKEQLGGIEINRPDPSTELIVRTEAESYVRQRYRTGKYTNAGEINAIIQDLFDFYDKMLKGIIPSVASRDFMSLVLNQYDLSAEIHAKYGNGQLGAQESEIWQKFGPKFRRAIMYLAECTAMLAPDESPKADRHQLVELIDRCWICAEEMVRLSILSTQTFALFPDDTTFELRPQGEEEWLILQLRHPERFEEFGERGRRDTASRKNFIDELAIIYNKNRVKDILDDRFKASCGFTMINVFQVGFSLNRKAPAPANIFDAPFCKESQIFDELQRALDGNGDAAMRLINGLVLRKNSMIAEGRVLWKPKQEYRAFTRPFFEFPHQTGTHFIWSRKMADDCLMMLYTRLVQKHLPPEWRIGSVPQAIENYAFSITKEFESIVNASLAKCGIVARTFKSVIGQRDVSLKIPDHIGEIDVLGYWEKEKLLIVGECKLVKSTEEPATFRDDVSKFIGDGDNYLSQIQRKTAWIAANVQQVAIALQSLNGFPGTVVASRVAPVLITYYPAFASLLFSDVPCVALTELMADVKRAGKWPYEQVHKIAE